MIESREAAGCIEMIHQAALDPELWSEALASMTRLFHGDHSLLFTNKRSRSTTPFVATAGLDDGDRVRFFSSHALRLWDPWHDVIAPGRVIAQQEIIGDRDFERLEIYNEVIRPTGGFYSSCFQHDAGLSFHLNVCRLRRRGPFSPEEIRDLQALMPHVSLALRVRTRLALLHQRSNALAAALDCLAEGAIIADGDGSPVLLNAEAKRILAQSDGLTIGPSGLKGATTAATERLRGAILRLSLPNAAESVRVHLPRHPPRPPLLLDILPIGRPASAVANGPVPMVVIFIRTPDTPLSVDKAALIDFYALTPREAEIAALLATGMTVERIAATLAIAAGTVRNNLKRAFEKTGAHSQVALAAVVRSFGKPAAGG